MSGRVDAFFEFVRRLGELLASALRSLTTNVWRFRWRVLTVAVMVLIVYGLCTHPPIDSVRRGEVLARTDSFDGSVSVYTSGTVLVLPGIHQVRRYSIRDQVYRPTESASATGPAPLAKSSANTNIPSRRPRTRPTLVAPMLPLPCSKILTPRIRATR